jgi:hypothetical protein
MGETRPSKWPYWLAALFIVVLALLWVRETDAAPDVAASKGSSESAAAH